MNKPNPKTTRWFLKILGVFLLTTGLYLEINEKGLHIGYLTLVIIGLSILLAGQFGSNKLIEILEMLLTGWL